MPNNITATILDDGSVRIETDKISAPNHSSAEAALQWIVKELGGDATRERVANVHHHEHDHDHTHEHDHNHMHA